MSVTFPQLETSFGFIKRRLQAACRSLSKIHAHMKFLFEKLRTTIGVTKILGRIAAGLNLNPDRATLKRRVQIGHPFSMRMIQRFRDAQNSSQAPDHALIVVTQRGVRDVMAGRLRLAIVIANHRSHHGSVSALETRNVSIKRKILAMLVVPAMADHMADIVEQRPRFE